MGQNRDRGHAQRFRRKCENEKLKTELSGRPLGKRETSKMHSRVCQSNRRPGLKNGRKDRES